MTTVNTKPWWASKTLWVNALALVAAVSGAFGLDIGLDGETQTAIVGGVMGIVNIFLRLMSKDVLEGTAKARGGGSA